MNMQRFSVLIISGVHGEASSKYAESVLAYESENRDVYSFCACLRPKLDLGRSAALLATPPTTNYFSWE